MSIGKIFTASLMASTAFIYATPSCAQSEATEQASEDAGLSQPNVIVVTAQKREQRLSVAALGGDELVNQRIANVGDLAKVVPGLSYTPSPNSTPVYTLRGVGFFETSVAAYPNVTTYIDQAPLPLPAMSALTAFDLQRVEVLKGPQGTLFGNNATGGAINFIANKPSDELTAGIKLGYGRFQRVEAEAFVSGPLSDTVGARLVVKAVNSDDWQYSYTRNDTLGKTEQYAGRFIIDFEPSDNFDLTLNLNGWIDRSDPQAPQLKRQSGPSDLQIPIGTVGFTGAVTADLPLLSYPAAPRNSRAADWNMENRPFQDNDLWQATLTGNLDIGDAVTLTSITNYVEFNLLNATEGDGTALFLLDLVRDRAQARTFTQELRIANSDPTARFRWVLGGNYDDTEVFEEIDLIFPDASSGIQQGFSADRYSSDQRMENVAVFGNAEFDIIPSLTVKGGVRYTESQRDTVNGSFQLPGYVEPFPGSPGLTNFINIVFANVYTPTFCPGVVYQPINPADSVSINPDTCQSGNFVDSLDEDNISWSIGADFKPVDDLLLYANIAKGFKAGSYPTVSAASFAQYAPVVQESVIDYEFGIKSQPLPGLSINAAAFYYDYSNKQVRGKTVDPLFGALDVLVNVPKSIVKGAEVEIAGSPFDGLSARVAATYLDTKVERFNGVVGVTQDPMTGFLVPTFQDFSGVELPFAPEFQLSAALDYEFPVSNDLAAFVGTNLYGQTKSYGSLQLNPAARADALIPGYFLVDLRAGVKTFDDNLKVTLWGRNVFNKFYLTNSLRAYDTVIQYTGRPAEYGISLGWNY